MAVFSCLYLTPLHVLTTDVLSCLTKTGSLQIFYSCLPLRLSQKYRTYMGKRRQNGICNWPLLHEYKYALAVSSASHSFQARLYTRVFWMSKLTISSLKLASVLKKSQQFINLRSTKVFLLCLASDLYCH